MAFRLVALASLTLSATAFAQGSGGTNAPAQENKPYVVLVSFDGMRPEYLKRIDLPNFTRLRARGVTAEGMIPTFPSKTFPNHYTVVTGLHAGNHGIVSNSFLDPASGQYYRYTDTLTSWDAKFYRGEPVWVTAERQGMVAASFFWPGAMAPIKGVRPTITKPYDNRVANSARVDSVLAWLALPSRIRPHFTALYFSTLDNAGHEHGPLSAQVDTAAWAMDTILGQLMDGIERLPIANRVYLVLTSDHGMLETSPRWYAALDTLIDMTGVRMGDAGPNVHLYVDGGLPRARVLRDSINRRMRHGRAYVRGELPARLVFGDPRIGDLVVLMDDHYQIGRANRPAREGGNHGWDPTNPLMHAIFIAAGPRIPQGKAIPTFSAVEVYPFMTEVLGLTPAARVDGRKGFLAGLIRRAH
jgi:predicted AlkP superfamily pyrophosphatase or phosphodiesterase